MEKISTLIIGAGVIGLAIAEQLSKTSTDIILAEQEKSFGQHTSSRNSEVIVAQQRIQSLWDLAGRDKPYRLFAYPYGRYNADQVSFLNSVGYDLAFSERRVSHHLLSERLYLSQWI